MNEDLSEYLAKLWERRFYERCRLAKARAERDEARAERDE